MSLPINAGRQFTLPTALGAGTLTRVHDVAVIIVSYGSARWLPPCLEALAAHTGAVATDVIVADNDPGDEVAVALEPFPWVRRIPCENRGFAAGNNVGIRACDARYLLFLNPDTEILDGTLEDLIRRLDERPEVGAVGVRQVEPDGTLTPTVRRFPTPSRALAEALGVERLPLRRATFGERVLDLDRYGEEIACDWTSGSFILARREAILGSGMFDERFFLFSEEVDLCRRIRQAGWEIRHFPYMEILHHSRKAGIVPRLEAQQAFARRQYARKHFAPAPRVAYLAGIMLRHALRAGLAGLDPPNAEARRETARIALPLIMGRGVPPFGPLAPVAVSSQRPRDPGAQRDQLPARSRTRT